MQMHKTQLYYYYYYYSTSLTTLIVMTDTYLITPEISCYSMIQMNTWVYFERKGGGKENSENCWDRNQLYGN